MKNKKILLLFITSILIISFLSNLVLAIQESYAPVKQGDCILLKQTCGTCSYMNISVAYPNSTWAISNQVMTNRGGGNWEYNFCSTSLLGRYDTPSCGDLNGIYQCTEGGTISFEVTTNGSIWTSSALPILIFLFFLAFAFIISGYLMDNAWLAVMSGFCFTIAGIFIVTFGIASVSNFYTQSMAIIVLGMGIIMMIGASYSIIDDSSEHHGVFYFGDKKEKDESDYFEEGS